MDGRGLDARYNTKEKKTNKKGVAVISGRSCGRVYVIIEKEGYYRSKVSEVGFKDVKFNRWQPWNKKIKVVLKKRINPVPMYAKMEVTDIPELDKEIGYDLMVGDWVEPYGKGKVSDLIFKGHLDYKSDDEYTCKLTITFSNEGDGIIEGILEKKIWKSELPLPRYAPEDGYKDKFERIIIENPKKPLKLNEVFNKNRYYFIRVRSKMKDGKVVKALYGKIRGDIEFLYNYEKDNKKVSVEFTYYLNPDGTRNMEYDTKRNLFKGEDCCYNIREH